MPDELPWVQRMDGQVGPLYRDLGITTERRGTLEVSATLRQLGQAIARHPNPVQVAYCGFDLWVEVMSSGRTRLCNFKKGGKIATGDEDGATLVIPIMVVGDAIVINFDPTLPPDGFRLAP